MDYTYQVMAKSGTDLGTPSQIMGFSTITDFNGSYNNENCVLYITMSNAYYYSIKGSLCYQ